MDHHQRTLGSETLTPLCVSSQERSAEENPAFLTFLCAVLSSDGESPPRPDGLARRTTDGQLRGGRRQTQRPRAAGRQSPLSRMTCHARREERAMGN